MLESPATKSRTGSIELSLKDYGPISRGRVALKPLTILVGPSGCGKTHVATLLHSALKAEEMQIDWDRKDMLRLPDAMKSWHLKESPPSVLHDEAKRIYDLAQNNKLVHSDICKHVAEFWSKSFESVLYRNTSSFFKHIRAGSERFELEVATEVNRGKFVHKIEGREELQATELDHADLSIEFKKYRDNAEMNSDDRLCRDKNAIRVKVPAVCQEFDVYDALKRGVTSLTPSIPNRSIYFPAERSGLALLINILLSRGSRGRRGIPKLSDIPGAVADLLLWLVDIKDVAGAFAPMAEIFENDALGGKIVFQVIFQPQIYYEVAEKSFSIREAASSVKDVALFLLYLKHIAKRGDLVILEEPEINLHPSSQLLLARLIARLVCAGLHMVVSTHSPYFLEQLSHCVLGGTIQNEKREKVLSSEECPKVEDVALYQFKPHDGGYEICNVNITEEGIPQDEFTNVDNNLYGELTRLRQAEE